MNNNTRHTLAAAVLAAAGFFAAAFAQAAGPSLAGIWMLEGDFSTLKTSDGKLPPLKPEARRTYQAALAARKAGKPAFDTLTRCLPHGLPRLMFAPYPIEVIQEAKQVTFLHEAHHMPRMVYVGDKLPPNDDLDGNYMGFSAGRWDGDTLVIDSGGFNDLTTLDKAGLPHSDQMTLNERMRLIDGGARLEDIITITDAESYTKPWSVRVTFKRMPADYWLKEFVCTDKNPDAS